MYKYSIYGMSFRKVIIPTVYSFEKINASQNYPSFLINQITAKESTSTTAHVAYILI